MMTNRFYVILAVLSVQGASLATAQDRIGPLLNDFPRIQLSDQSLYVREMDALYEQTLSALRVLRMKAVAFHDFKATWAEMRRELVEVRQLQERVELSSGTYIADGIEGIARLGVALESLKRRVDRLNALLTLNENRTGAQMTIVGSEELTKANRAAHERQRASIEVTLRQVEAIRAGAAQALETWIQEHVRLHSDIRASERARAVLDRDYRDMIGEFRDSFRNLYLSFLDELQLGALGEAERHILGYELLLNYAIPVLENRSSTANQRAAAVELRTEVFARVRLMWTELDIARQRLLSRDRDAERSQKEGPSSSASFDGSSRGEPNATARPERYTDFVIEYQGKEYGADGMVRDVIVAERLETISEPGRPDRVIYSRSTRDVSGPTPVMNSTMLELGVRHSLDTSIRAEIANDPIFERTEPGVRVISPMTIEAGRADLARLHANVCGARDRIRSENATHAADLDRLRAEIDRYSEVRTQLERLMTDIGSEVLTVVEAADRLRLPGQFPATGAYAHETMASSALAPENLDRFVRARSAEQRTRIMNAVSTAVETLETGLLVAYPPAAAAIGAATTAVSVADTILSAVCGDMAAAREGVTDLVKDHLTGKLKDRIDHIAPRGGSGQR